MGVLLVIVARPGWSLNGACNSESSQLLTQQPMLRCRATMVVRPPPRLAELSQTPKARQRKCWPFLKFALCKCSIAIGDAGLAMTSVTGTGNGDRYCTSGIAKRKRLRTPLLLVH